MALPTKPAVIGQGCPGRIGCKHRVKIAFTFPSQIAQGTRRAGALSRIRTDGRAPRDRAHRFTYFRLRLLCLALMGEYVGRIDVQSSRG